MVAVSLALFIFDEIMWPSITTDVSEGPRIMLRYIKNGFLDIHQNHLFFNGDGSWNLYANLQQWIFRQHRCRSSDVEFLQTITFGCLSSLLTWAKNKHELLKCSRSPESSDVGIPSLSSFVQLWSRSTHISTLRGPSAIAEPLVTN